MSDKISIKRLLFNFMTRPLVYFLKRPNKVSVSIVEAARPVYRQKLPGLSTEILYECPSFTALWRASTLYSKEPDTIKWLNSLPAGDVLYDVGANVGMYSIYAAARGLRVFSFEPEAKNFALLNRNIHLNNFQDKISAFGLALGLRTELNYLHLSSDIVGGAINNFGEAIDYNGKTFSAAFVQGAVSMSMDSLWSEYGLPEPNHIKIDVDGLEAKIISGAGETLKMASLKSVLVELNDELPSDIAIVDKMKSLGFQCGSKFHAPMFDDTEYKNIYNYIFYKK
jgi:FkbM family methyltransferase